MVAPEIVAALITSAAGFVPGMFKDKSQAAKAPPEPEILLAENYDGLRTSLTDNCVRILKRMEHGDNFSRSALVEVIYPDIGQGERKRLVSREFSYRMDYLVLLGLVSQAGARYLIAPLGRAFLEEARKRKHYIGVLFV